MSPPSSCSVYCTLGPAGLGYKMEEAAKSSLFTPDPYYIPGYSGFCPQLQYQQGRTFGATTSHLLTDPSVTKSPHSLLAPLRLPPTHTTADPPTLQHHPTDKGIVLPEVYIPPGYAGHRPMLQFQHATSFSRMVANAADEFLEVQSSMTRGRVARPEDRTQDIHTTRHWKPEAEYKSPLATYKTPKPDQTQSLQRKAISGYAGFIPRYQWSMGVSFTPGVRRSMDEFEDSQIQVRYPQTSSERRLKPTYWPTAKIYSPAGLLPKYAGFVPGFRDTYGSTYGNTTRQLYINNAL